ncbi:hypothetical protein RDV89_15875 [Nocardioides zeae]|uniref:Uncharacterized protein n=1 Tax=Nocardioides imazamoxiresistens TaxID=3231893 RepID=A0ABU3PZ68_9ACTN|nr:hypothetical protein [Nocardioides zeae]MDT9594563.1 hypothetical protein [Nocardioides zeae]
MTFFAAILVLALAVLAAALVRTVRADRGAPPRSQRTDPLAHPLDLRR